jgi:glycosyltransferase involved in cell wall biosynthesis
VKQSVSVIIPSHDRAQVLCRALDSVLTQTVPAAEIIVVDDGSTDNTAALVAQRYPQVSYLYQPNQGVSKARNSGVEESRGEWLAFLDSDDEWLPEKLEKQMAALQQQPHYRLCHTDEIWIRNGKRVNPMDKHAKSGGFIFENCLPLCAISPSSVLIKRDLFEQTGGFDEQLPACEDYDLWLRICAANPVLFLEQQLLRKYGGHADQLSRKHWGMDRFRVQALEKILQSGVLDARQASAVTDTLRNKCQILAAGARKRGNMERAEHYAAKIANYRHQLMEQVDP